MPTAAPTPRQQTIVSQSGRPSASRRAATTDVRAMTAAIDRSSAPPTRTSVVIAAATPV
jgi:hypothetical protein